MNIRRFCAKTQSAFCKGRNATLVVPWLFSCAILLILVGMFSCGDARVQWSSSEAGSGKSIATKSDASGIGSQSSEETDPGLLATNSSLNQSPILDRNFGFIMPAGTNRVLSNSVLSASSPDYLASEIRYTIVSLTRRELSIGIGWSKLAWQGGC